MKVPTHDQSFIFIYFLFFYITCFNHFENTFTSLFSKVPRLPQRCHGYTHLLMAVRIPLVKVTQPKLYFPATSLTLRWSPRTLIWKTFLSCDSVASISVSSSEKMESIWLDIESQFHSNNLQLLGNPGRILVPPVTQVFRSKGLNFFFQCSK